MCGFIFTNEFIPAELKSTLHISFPGGSHGKETSCHAGHLGLISGSGRSPGEGKGYPLQYSGLENSMGSQRVGHNRSTFTFSSTLGFPGGPSVYRPWSLEELDMTE